MDPLKLNKKLRMPESKLILKDSVARLSQVSAYKLLDDFEELKILKEMTGYRRNRIFWFEEYFKVFK